MTEEPLIAPAQIDLPVHPGINGAERPLPTDQQEQVADDLFTPDQERAVAAVLGVQMGLGLLHTLAAEASSVPDAEHLPRRRTKDEEEKVPE